MVKYGFERKTYGVFNVEDQHVEFCPVFDYDGDYKGIAVTIYSKDKRNYRGRHVVPGRGAIILDREIEISGTNGYTKNINLETNYDLGILSIHFGDTIGIEYGCRKK